MFNFYNILSGCQYIIFAIQSNRMNSAANNSATKLQNDIPESFIYFANISNVFFKNKSMILAPVNILHIHAAC